MQRKTAQRCDDNAPPVEVSDDASLEGATKQWRDTCYDPAIRKVAERRAFVSDIGIEVKPLYTPLDVAESGRSYVEDIGFPGQYPFTRGDRAGMFQKYDRKRGQLAKL